MEYPYGGAGTKAGTDDAPTRPICSVSFLFGGKNRNKPTTFVVSMEYTGFEPVASTMRMWRAPNCANTPYENYITKEQNFKYVFRRKIV